MKKIILSLIILSGLGLAITPALAYTPRESDLIKTYNNPAIYFIDSNGYRHLFSTRATFFSWYKGEWKDQNILTISEDDFVRLPVGKNVTIKPGFSLIRFDNSLKMFAVLPNGKICRAPAHYGNYQYKRATVIPASFESDYYNDGVCDITDSQKLPDGTLLRYTGSADTYYIQNGQRRKISDNGFLDNNFYRDSVIEDVAWSMSYTDGNGLYNRENSIASVGYNFGTNYNYNYNYNYNCQENWTCYSWGNCSNGSQSRSCYDSSNCGTTYSKPVTSQACYNSCSENWSCNAWSSCAYNRQYRTCWDNNSCGTTNSKPIESQSCSTCTENWSCNSWGSCTGTGSSGWQYRSCWDNNRCGTYLSQPLVSKTCALCAETWSCTAWSICSNNKQYRSCLDTNRCGTTASKPVETQTCR